MARTHNPHSEDPMTAAGVAFFVLHQCSPSTLLSLVHNNAIVEKAEDANSENGGSMTLSGAVCARRIGMPSGNSEKRSSRGFSVVQ